MTHFFIELFSQIAVPEVSDKAMSYYKSGNILWILEWLQIMAIPFLLLVTGLSGRLGRFAKRYGKNWFFSLLIYLISFVAFYQILSLPLAFYSGYLREHAYGLSTQSIGRWVANFGNFSMVILLTGAAFLWIFYLLLKRSPKRWWIYSSLTTMCVIFILTFVLPIWIDPLFNTFGPMKNKQIEKQILDLAAKAGMGDVTLLEVDKSKDTTLGNAYVTGIGSTKRIVLWDTIIDDKHPESALFIMGHEMGHYVLNHVWLWMGYYAILSFAICYLIYKISGFLLSRYHHIFRFQHLHDVASVPLFLVMINFFLFLQTPCLNALSRYMEIEADRFGIEITQNNTVAAEGFASAVSGHLANPRPGVIYKIWRSHHPSLGDRVDFCNSYCPWETGQPLKYAEHFKIDNK